MTNHSADIGVLLRQIETYTNAYEGAGRFEVKNPATGDTLAYAPDMTGEDAEAAIAAAAQAAGDWAQRTAKARGDLLKKWNDLILQHKDGLAALLTAEQGKPIAEARGEIVYGASFVEWFAEEGKRAYGDVIPSNAQSRRLVVLKQPIGVVAAITPWNFPNAMITRKVAPALAAGCPIVVKPAEDTPLSAIALELLAHEAGIPEGVFKVLPAAQAEAIGAVFTQSPAVRKLSFTGSTQVGKILMRACADTVKKVSMELGGNAPFIVFEDADLDAAADGAILSKFRNAGQTCVCANRLLVQASIKDDFVEKFTEKVKAFEVGDGAQDGVAIGPLINQKAIDKVEELVADAVAKGGRAVIGGKRHDYGALFFEPTIMENISPSMAIAESEIFGPVAPILTFDTEDEAVALANDTPYGLAAYFWTRDHGRAWRVTEALEYGMVGINEGVISSEAAPFGGIKESGIGREGSKYGLDEFFELKYASMGGL
ncbi:MAG: NAD-dependent succinate-semialdehyde dehydrogenase [Pseudomonadota bacterium]